MNSYSQGLMTLADRVAAQGWPGPLIVTEMGALGLFACLAEMIHSKMNTNFDRTVADELDRLGCTY